MLLFDISLREYIFIILIICSAHYRFRCLNPADSLFCEINVQTLPFRVFHSRIAQNGHCLKIRVFYHRGGCKGRRVSRLIRPSALSACSAVKFKDIVILLDFSVVPRMDLAAHPDDMTTSPNENFFYVNLHKLTYVPTTQRAAI